MNVLIRRQSLLVLLLALAAHGPAHAQAISDDNWFQIEVTVFLYEDANLDMENWSPNRLSVAFPERLRRLRQVSDSLQLSDWSVLAPALAAPLDSDALDALETPVAPVVGPAPYAPAQIGFRLPDIARTAFLQLPPDAHDFTGTNRAITQSAAHRIVFHGVWRQLMTRRGAANAVAVMGGRTFNERREVEGSLSFYLTNSGDRIILENNLWLNRFGTQAEEDSPWKLPVLPAILTKQSAEETPEQTQFFVNRIIQFAENRDLRVREFHYLDHPAMGLLVQVSPYTLPPLPLPPLDLPGNTPAANASVRP
tara:strand:- start:420 stop:1346 length:927 start_codon:yes stop_codon:yes gene_type:complete